MKCLICGEEILKDATIDDAVLLRGILEDGTWWEGYAFICSFDCFKILKKRAFKDKHGKALVFIT